ncbi:MAG: nickel-dependent putative hexonate epimerase [Planctomycetota bacterium]|jgi:nickel-dependent lactate racemase
MLLYARGNEDDNLTGEDLQQGLHSALDKLGSKKKVLAIPPDFTRYHSRAGELTALTRQYYGGALTDVLPALGTHAPMAAGEIGQMFEGVPPELFRKHNWRTDLVTLGEVPAEFVREVSEGRVDYSWPAQVNRLLVEGGFDLILSIGQVVPHEVSGMANYNKNIFIGTGGADGINKSHFLGAAYGMERIMGRADNPVRRVINYASDHFAKDMPIVYVLTVVSADKDGALKTRGLFIGDDIECFDLAAELSLKVNFQMLDEPLQKVVVHLDPSEYKSTWLGNKSIYRTRMAMADGGELIVLAPGVSQFGEDRQIDRLIRKYGYVGTPRILDAVQKNDDLRENLSAAAHLIHGSSEGRFTITYCPGKLSRQEIEAANFGFAELEQMKSRYNPARLSDGLNTLADGERVFFISNPAIGLWAYRGRFGQD